MVLCCKKIDEEEEMSREDKIINFLKEIERFKYVERKVYSSDLRPENDAEHSYYMAMFLILFEKDLPKGLDMEKMLKLALVHDLPELYAGDFSIFDKEGRKEKKEKEALAAKKLFSQLPEDLEKEIMDLFKEYEEQETPEAKIVKGFDKIQPLLLNLCSEGEAWKREKISIEDIINVKKKFVEHDEFLFRLFNRLLDDAKDKGLL